MTTRVLPGNERRSYGPHVSRSACLDNWNPSSSSDIYISDEKEDGHVNHFSGTKREVGINLNLGKYENAFNGKQTFCCLFCLMFRGPGLASPHHAPLHNLVN